MRLRRFDLQCFHEVCCPFFIITLPAIYQITAPATIDDGGVRSGVFNLALLQKASCEIERFSHTPVLTDVWGYWFRFITSTLGRSISGKEMASFPYCAKRPFNLYLFLSTPHVRFLLVMAFLK